MGWVSQQYGSFERFLVALAERCSDRGATTHLIFPAVPASEAFVRDVAARIHVIPSPAGPADPRFALAVRRLLVQTQATHLHTHFGVAGYHALAVAGLGGRPRCYTTKHNVPALSRRTLARTRHRWMAAHVERVFAVGETVAERLTRLGVPRDKIDVCYLGVDPSAYRPDPRARLDVRTELGLPPDARLVLSTSHLRPGKGVDNLPWLAAELSAAGDDVTVVIAGDGPLRPELQRTALDLRLAPEVLRLVGVRQDIPRLLAAADLFVFPTDTFAEGLPLGVVEAMAAAVPVVATAVSDIPTLLADAALVVPPGDRAALLAACRRLLDDRGLGAGLARQGRALVERHLTASRAAEFHVERYGLEAAGADDGR